MVTNNRGVGIKLVNSYYNLIYDNYFNNTENVSISDTLKPNFWNVSASPGPNIGGPSIGGNYWAKPDGTGFSQTCDAADGDGFCDFPFVLAVNNTDFLPLAMVNQPPVAAFDYSPQHPKVGQTITFDASASYDPDGSIISYEWDFGDGTTASGAVVSHAYASAGRYNVTLNVTDNGGAVNTTSLEINVVSPQGGIAVAVRPKISRVSAGNSVTLNVWLISVENFDDTLKVYLTTAGIPPGYAANLSWFNWTEEYVNVPAGVRVVSIALQANVPSGVSGIKAFRVVAESQEWVPRAFDVAAMIIT